MEKITPITPEECAKKELPAFIIKAANNCIKRNYHNGYSRFYLTELFDEIIRTSTDEDFRKNTTLNVCLKGLREHNDKEKRNLIIANKWHLLADTYSKIGWKVTFDRPSRGGYDNYIFE